MMDWIKVEAPTPNKPEILRLARILGVTRDDAFGKAMRFWLWLDGVTVDGRVDGVAPTDVDAVVGCDGFAAALCEVGWLTCNDGSEWIEVPNFQAHNGASAKARSGKARRQASWRAGRVDAAVDTPAPTAAPTREEKRRISNTPSSPTKTSNEQDAKSGDGGGSWRKTEQKLVALGIVDARRVAQLSRLPAFEADAIIDHWAALGQWGLPALHYRLVNGVPGASPSDAWPPPGKGRAQGEDKQLKRKQARLESLAYQIVRDGRKAKQTDEQIQAELDRHGCKWPGGEAA